MKTEEIIKDDGTIQVTSLGSVKVESVELSDQLDKDFGKLAFIDKLNVLAGGCGAVLFSSEKLELLFYKELPVSWHTPTNILDFCGAKIRK